MRKYNAKAPVKPIGRILYNEQYGNNRVYPEVPAKFDKVCECKGFSDDRPFSVYKATSAKDKKPFKVVFHWWNDKPRKVKVNRGGQTVDDNDADDMYMMDILEEHATKNAAQTAMRRFATEAFAKVNDAPQGEGAVCHNRIGGWDDEREEGKLSVRIGDLVTYSGIPDTLWRVAGERRKDSRWFLQIVPVYVFMGSLDVTKKKEIYNHDCVNMIYPVDLVQLGSTYAQLGNVAVDEAKRLAT